MEVDRYAARPENGRPVSERIKIMKIAAIHLRKKDKTSAGVEKADAKPGAGLRGGVMPTKSGRELSLLAGELLPGLRTLGGLCTARFDADVITGGLDYGLLKAGDRLKLGEAIIEITEKGKRCFDECAIRRRGERCPLPDSCAYARVEWEGALSVGDEITFIGEKPND